MKTYLLKILLLSDTNFGRGDGVAGLIDQEVEHDADGFPYLRGRTLKGLLSEECDNLVAVLPPSLSDRWEKAAEDLFGISGSILGTTAKMHIGDACLPEDLRAEVGRQLEYERSSQAQRLTEMDILSSLTTIRHQTAINPENGTPVINSLRAIRVIMRDLCFTSQLSFEEEPTADMLSLLAVGTLALRRVGSGRNRGLGSVCCTLHLDGTEITENHFRHFEQETKA